MGNFVYNVAKGRVAEFANRVDQNDPTNAVFVVVVIDTSETDGTLQDLDTLALVLANGNTAEVTNTNYARLILDDTDIAVVAADDTNDRMEIDMDDPAWTAVASGDGWTDLLVCYDSDSTGGDDTNIIPCTQHDFAVTPDGSNITGNVAATGFFRAS